MQVKLDLQRPVHLETWGDTIETAALQSAQLTFNDLGYIAKRNAYCARSTTSPRRRLSDYHMQEVARFTAAGGSAIGQGTAGPVPRLRRERRRRSRWQAGTRK